MEKKIEQEQATARKNAKTNKRAALNALKRKKRQLFNIKSFENAYKSLLNYSGLMPSCGRLMAP